MPDRVYMDQLGQIWFAKHLPGLPIITTPCTHGGPSHSALYCLHSAQVVVTVVLSNENKQPISWRLNNNNDTVSASAKQAAVYVSRSTSALFVRVKITNATVGGGGERRMLPTWWSANYVSVLPGERRVLTAECCAATAGETPYRATPSLLLEVDGFNVEPVTVPVSMAPD